MSAKLTDEERKLLFPINKCAPVAHSAFKLARFLKHNRRLNLRYEAPQVQEVVSEWMEEARKAYPPEDLVLDDVEELVRVGWFYAHYPLGCNPLDDATERANTIPHYPDAPKGYGECHSTIYRLLYWLNVFAVKSGDHVFFAGSHAIAKRLNINQCIVYRALKRMERDKILKISEAGNTQRANRYDVFLTPD